MDNGSNWLKVVKSKKRSKDSALGSGSNEEEYEDDMDDIYVDPEEDSDDNDDDDDAVVSFVPGESRYKSMPCFPYTIWLVLRELQEDPQFKILVTRARALVIKVRYLP